MIPLPLSELVLACQARVEGNPDDTAVVSSISLDTRSLIPGSLFVALHGDRFDGHRFLNQAADRGAIAAVVSDLLADPPLPLLVTPNTLNALGALARRIRVASKARVVGVTGSVGKTTTKELLGLALRPSFRTLLSPANHNNEIGVSSTLLSLTPEHEVVVLEMAMRAPGEIEWLTRVALPNVAVITNIGVSHIGRLGSQEAIADAKAEIFLGLQADGVAVINRDDAFFDWLAKKTANVVSYGMDDRADYNAQRLEDRGLLGIRFECRTKAEVVPVNLSRGGIHLVLDALASLATAGSLGVPLSDAAAALSEFSPFEGRGSLRYRSDGVLVVDDTYNASTDSVIASLQLLRATPGCDRRMAVLGDMLEMGSHAEQGHRLVGRAAVEAGIHRLVCVGPESQAMADEAGRMGMAPDRVCWYPNSESAAKNVHAWFESCDAVLIKGSHGTRMDIIVQALLEN